MSEDSLQNAKEQTEGILKFLKLVREMKDADPLHAYTLLNGDEPCIDGDTLKEYYPPLPLDMEIERRLYLLITTGGPGFRLVLKYRASREKENEPYDIEAQYNGIDHDWTDYPLTGEEKQIMLEYFSRLYTTEHLDIIEKTGT